MSQKKFAGYEKDLLMSNDFSSFCFIAIFKKMRQGKKCTIKKQEIQGLKIDSISIKTTSKHIG